MKSSIFQVFKQEYPTSAKPYRIIETVITTDGPRSRICDGCWETFVEAVGVCEHKELEQNASSSG